MLRPCLPRHPQPPATGRRMQIPVPLMTPSTTTLHQQIFSPPRMLGLRQAARAKCIYSPTTCTLGTDAYSRAAYATMASGTAFWDFKPKDKKGNEYDLDQLKGKVVLVVNTASKCGFTPQFAGLEQLYKDLKPSHPDFEILGFPCNQFGGQDPGSNDDIQSFCKVNYGVSFPVLGKTNVNGDAAEPVWEWMKKSKPGLMGLQRIKWNFEKFLIGRDGKVVQRWASTSKPEGLKSVIEAELKKGAPATPTQAEGPTPTSKA